MCSRNIKKIVIVLVIVVTAFTTSACTPRLTLLSPQEAVSLERELVNLLKSGLTLMRTGDLEEAQATFDIAKELSPSDARVLDALGCVAFRRGALDRAKDYFSQSVASDRKYSRAYAHLALVAETNGDFKEAALLYKMAIKLNPLNFRGRHNYGIFVKHSYNAEELSKWEKKKAEAVRVTRDKL